MSIAWLVFRENVDRRLLTGAFAILAGAVLLSWQRGPGGVGLGALAIIGACAAWGVDKPMNAVSTARGRGNRRSTAAVMMPSVPSAPMKRWRRS